MQVHLLYPQILQMDIFQRLKPPRCERLPEVTLQANYSQSAFLFEGDASFQLLAEQINPFQMTQAEANKLARLAYQQLVNHILPGSYPNTGSITQDLGQWKLVARLRGSLVSPQFAFISFFLAHRDNPRLHEVIKLVEEKKADGEVLVNLAKELEVPVKISVPSEEYTPIALTIASMQRDLIENDVQDSLPLLRELLDSA